MARTVASTPFAGWLNEHLETRGWGARTLARKINPSEPENPRRAINRYLLEGRWPTDEYRQAIAVALEVDVDEMPTDEEKSDDEEDDSEMRRAVDLMAELMAIIAPKPNKVAA